MTPKLGAPRRYLPEASYFDLLVPNQDTVRFSYLQDRLLSKQSPKLSRARVLLIWNRF